MAITLLGTYAVEGTTVYDVSVEAGSLIVVELYSNGVQTLTGTTCMDYASGGSNSYSLIGSGLASSESNATHWIYYAISKSTQTLTIDSSFPAPNLAAVFVNIYSGSFSIATVLAQFATKEDSTDTSAPTGASLTTTVSDLLLHNAWCENRLGVEPTISENGRGFTLHDISWASCTSHRIVAATGTYYDSLTCSAAAKWSSTLVAFKEAGTTATNETFSPTGTSGQLEIGGVDVISYANVTSLVRTDWQGTITLSQASRTNLLLNSNDLTMRGNWNGVPVLTTTTVEDNQTTAGAQAANPPITVPNDSTSYTAQCRVGKGTTLSAIIISVRGGTNQTRYYCINTSTGAYVISDGGSTVYSSGFAEDLGSYGWQVSVSVSNNSSGNTLLYFVIAPAAFSSWTNGVAPALVLDAQGTIAVYDSMLSVGVNGWQTHIPTTSAAASITDYSYTSAGVVTLGQTASGTYVWSGSGVLAGLAAINETFSPTGTSGQLTIGGVDVVSDANVTSLVRTDWQGAVQLSSTSRTNYFPYSNSPGDWLSVSSTRTTGQSSPDGGTLAVRIANTTADDEHYAYTIISTVSAGTYRCRVRAKAGTYTTLGICLGFDGFWREGLFDLSNGTIINFDAGTNPSITALGSGWYLCEIDFTCSAASEVYFEILLVPTLGYVPYIGDGSYLYVCMPEFNNIAGGPYIPNLSTGSTSITDYRYTDFGVVTLGQTATGTYTWNGSGNVSGPVATAFQSNAFQSNAFQIINGAVVYDATRMFIVFY